MVDSEKVTVVGGCGHIGLPLSILSALRGRKTAIFDIDSDAVARVREGTMPFLEDGAGELLKEALASEMLTVSDDPEVVRDAAVVVLVVGTPVDKYLNPRIDVIFDALGPLMQYLCEGQTLILRSTVYPGTSEKVADFFRREGLGMEVAFCPERVLQGAAIREIQELPQIISGFSERAVSVARDFFSLFTSEIVEVTPLEAELSKLFTNAYRYIEFAAVNQFYMIAENEGADYRRIEKVMKTGYPRLKNLPGPGFAAGPCLFKDTMQLAAFYQNHFSMGLSAVWVNEGLPDFIVAQIKKTQPLSKVTAGILGMAFKANNDDKRDSLSYKLRKLLRQEAGEVLCSDEFIRDSSFVTAQELIERCEVLIVGVPHNKYRDIRIPEGKTVVDVWNVLPS